MQSTSSTRYRRIGKVITACALAQAMTCFADGLTLGAGADYSSGKYGGTESTNIFFIPLTAKFDSGRLSYKVTVPWIRVTGTGVIIPGGLGGINSGGGEGGGSGGSVGVFGCAADNRSGARRPEDNGPCASTAAGGAAAAGPRRTDSGIGDVVAAVTLNAVDDSASGFSLHLTGKIKVPTADENRSLGSGKTDYAAQVEAEKSFGDPFVSLGVGHKWLGDPPGVTLKNVWYGAAGAGYRFSRETTAGVSFDWATAARSGGPSAQELSFYVSHRLTPHFKLNATVYGGLSNGSPDHGAGLSLSYAF